MPNLTIKDIAKMAGVSYTTVSRALNGEPYVKRETLEQILKVCRETGYTPNAIARRLKTQKTNAIGIIVPDISNVFFCEITRNIEWAARQKGYNVFMSSSFYDYGIEESNIQALLQNRVDGIIVSGVGDRSPQTISKYAEQIPMVFIGDNIPVTGSFIAVDNALGTRLATEYLISLGHKSYVFLGGRHSSISHRHRQEGFVEALKLHGITDYEIFSINDGSKIEDGYETALRYFEKSPRATAALTTSDHFALGVMQAAEEKGVKIPEDISLVGFDDIYFASLPKIHLTTVSQPKQLICESALGILFDLISGESTENIQKIISPSLIVRNTCMVPLREAGSADRSLPSK